MKLLTRTEEVILAAVWKLGDSAYGVTISEHITETTGISWKFGAIYGPLGRLVDNGFLRTIEGEPTPERGGRRKIFYELTKVGREALLEIKEMNEAVWNDMPSLESKRS